MQSNFRRTLARAAQSFMVAAGLLSLSPCLATAQGGTDWSGFRDALHADGIVQPGNVLCFDLVRRDLNISVSGHPVSPGEVANGYVHFTPTSGGNFFSDGSLPAQDWQANYVAAALRTSQHIRVSAIVNHGAGTNPALLWVHFEATGTRNQILPGIVRALHLISDPQIGVNAHDITVPPSWIPSRFRSLFSRGTVTQINDVYAFGAPRPDEQQTSLGNVRSNPFLGVGEYVYVLPMTSDGSQLAFNTEFALRSDEVQGVIDALQRGGFRVPALHDHFLDDHNRLYFVHGFAMGTDQASTTRYENTLYNVFQLIHAH